MSPEYLPELMLLLAGVFAGAFAVHLLASRQLRRASRAGAAALACIVLAIALGKSDCAHPVYSEHGRRFRPQANRQVLTPAAVDSTKEAPDEAPSLFLHLGGVRVRVVASNRYVLSVHDEPFLTLDSLASGLLVSCRVAGTEPGTLARGYSVAASISQNRVASVASYVESERPDPHTIVVRERGEDILRVRYADTRNIEVVGRFYFPGEAEPGLVSLTNGIRWGGGFVPSGSSVDLRPQGKGDLDFERSGSIRIIRAASASRH